MTEEATRQLNESIAALRREISRLKKDKEELLESELTLLTSLRSDVKEGTIGRVILEERIKSIQKHKP